MCIFNVSFDFKCTWHFGLEGKRKGSVRHRRRCEDNIKMNLREIGHEGVNWIQLAQNRDQLRTICDHSNEPSGSIEGGEFLDKMNGCLLLKKDSAPWKLLRDFILSHLAHNFSALVTVFYYRLVNFNTYFGILFISEFTLIWPPSLFLD
jgi:hypothetical protein